MKYPHIGYFFNFQMKAHTHKLQICDTVRMINVSGL